MGKLVRLILGPIHFETRFKPFLESNKNTLSNFIFLVDNYELYKPYIDLVEIVDINKLIENHPWSKDKEYIFSEKDPQKFIENYYEVCSKNYCSANISVISKNPNYSWLCIKMFSNGFVNSFFKIRIRQCIVTPFFSQV